MRIPSLRPFGSVVRLSCAHCLSAWEILNDHIIRELLRRVYLGALAVSCPHLTHPQASIVGWPNAIQSSNPTIHQYSYRCYNYSYYAHGKRTLNLLTKIKQTVLYHVLCLHPKQSTLTSQSWSTPSFAIFAGDLLSVGDLRGLLFCLLGKKKYIWPWLKCQSISDEILEIMCDFGYGFYLLCSSFSFDITPMATKLVLATAINHQKPSVSASIVN